MGTYMHSQAEINIVSKAIAEQRKVPAVPVAKNLRRAAVAAILRPGNSGSEVLFIRRAEREGDPWSGHMAFPGGHIAAEDSSLMDAAIRETKEEIGIDLNTNGCLLGPLSVTKPHLKQRHPISVSSFVFALQGSPQLHLNHEVEEVVSAPLGDLLAGALQTKVEKTFDGKPYKFPAFNVSGRIVWGMTYHMVQELLQIIRPNWPA